MGLPRVPFDSRSAQDNRNLYQDLPPLGATDRWGGPAMQPAGGMSTPVAPAVRSGEEATMPPPLAMATRSATNGVWELLAMPPSQMPTASTHRLHGRRHSKLHTFL